MGRNGLERNNRYKEHPFYAIVENQKSKGKFTCIFVGGSCSNSHLLALLCEQYAKAFAELKLMARIWKIFW